ncbi:AlbA family DNA-binding domain-containing protein [Sharpea azabuensis]|uniref:AlbA family DNA-binding domain-containing protein n=1 Tax=Sharpea azabuensis TaxID=322505 RepID=UPI000942C72F
MHIISYPYPPFIPRPKGAWVFCRELYKKEIIAFANCKGGILYIGVEDDGSVVVLNRKKRL